MKKLATTLMTALLLSTAGTYTAATAAEITSPAGAARVDAATPRLNLNTATVDDLTRLPGVGKKKAEAIIAYRESVGKFLEVAQLTEVKGIGEKMLAKIAEQVTVD